MNNLDLLEFLKKPEFYDHKVKSVNIIQTHISYIFLTGKYVYKIKKPVDYGFLDFSTLEKRKYFCKEELRLNQRLCPDLYIEVLPITRDNDKLKLNGDGKVVEYALKMKEFPQKNIMSYLIEKDRIELNVIDEIIDLLLNFYNKDKVNDEIESFGKTNIIRKNIEENFIQTRSVVDVTISREIYNHIQNKSIEFLDKNNDLFEERIRNHKIHNCHGDLHSGNIAVTKDNIYIFDCIEFNKQFRYCDVASELGFLAMDLDFLNHFYMSSYLVDSYLKKSFDYGIQRVLNFYKSYRSYVRGKVLGFRLDDNSLTSKDKNELLIKCKRYYDLSYYYSNLFDIAMNIDKPILFIVCGLTGSGKSTLSTKIGIDYNSEIINTDIVRKEVVGIGKYEKYYDKFDTGLYSPKKIESNYETVLDKTSKFLKYNRNVVVDATFQKKKFREMANNIAMENDAIFIPIECVVPKYIAKKWLDMRQKIKTVSDGRWEIYLNQVKTFEYFDPEEKCLKFDMSKNSFSDRMNYFNMILSMVREGAI